MRRDSRLRDERLAAKLQRGLRLAPLLFLSLLLSSELPIIPISTVHATLPLDCSAISNGTAGNCNSSLNQVRNQADAFRLIDEAPLAGGFANAYTITVKDAFNFVEAPGLRVRASWNVNNRFLFNEQVENESPPKPPSPLAILVRLVQDPLVLALGAIAALAVVLATFIASRRRRMQGCQEIASASPLCRYYGAKHACRLRPGHRGVHRCRCKVSWMEEAGEQDSGYPRGQYASQIPG